MWGESRRSANAYSRRASLRGVDDTDAQHCSNVCKKLQSMCAFIVATY